MLPGSHRLWLVPIAFLLATGCSKRYVLVTYGSSASTYADSAAEVFSTPRYGEVRDALKTAVVAVPSACLQESAAQQAGSTKQTRLVMAAECGIWLAEMEKALVQAGYRVISWSALRTVEERERLATHKAAKSVGADVIFMVNSMEFPTSKADRFEEQLLRYHESNPDGEPVQPAALGEKARNTIRGLAEGRLSPGGVESLTATLDLSTIYAETGEAFWFYRRTMTDRQTSTREARMLVRGREGWWRPVKPAGLADAQPRPEQVLSSEYKRNVVESPLDEERKKQQQLARVIFKDFLRNFQNGAPRG